MPANDYLVRSERLPRSWTWEIVRRSRPLGVRRRGENFSSEAAAKLAGEKVLRELLDNLAGKTPRREPDNRHSELICAICALPMNFDRRLPRVGAWPELFVF
jgi:hypothetical protein